MFCPHERLAPFNICGLQKLLKQSKQLNLPQLFQQVVVGNRRQSLYLVTHHEQRSNALDFCTSSFTTQVARCPSEAERMMCSRHMRNAASQMEMRYCLEKLLSKGNPSGPVKVTLQVTFATIHTTRAQSQLLVPRGSFWFCVAISALARGHFDVFVAATLLWCFCCIHFCFDVVVVDRRPCAMCSHPRSFSSLRLSSASGSHAHAVR